MAVDIFMQIAKVKGESADKKFANAIEVLAWSWGLTQSGTTHTGAGSGAGKVNVQDLSFTKYVDKSSPVLMQSCCNGRAVSDGHADHAQGRRKPLVYLIITMTNVLISSVSLATAVATIGRPRSCR